MPCAVLRTIPRGCSRNTGGVLATCSTPIMLPSCSRNTPRPLRPARNFARPCIRRPSGCATSFRSEYRRRFGNVLNADNAAELFPEYAASPASRAQFRPAVHPAAQWVRDKLFTRALADPNVREVIFTAGGNGAGKSTGGLRGDVVMDTTLSNPEHSEKLVQAV